MSTPTADEAAPTRAYDLWFGDTADTLQAIPGREGAPPTDPVVPVGWLGHRGPAIDPVTWPRGPVTGLPMMHVLTMWRPPEYRRRGEVCPGIAFFAGEGQLADPAHAPVADPASPDPFLAGLATARPHAELRLMTGRGRRRPLPATL